MKNKRLLQEVNSVLQHVSAALNSDRNSFFLYNEKLMVLETVVAQGVDDITLSVPIYKGIVGATFTKSKAIVENHVQNSPIFYSFYDTLLNYTTESTICVPVFDKSFRIIGVLQSLNKNNGYFQNQDVTVLKGFAATIALIVKNTNLYQESEENKNYLNTLIENLDNGIVTIDKTNTVQTVNNTFYRMFDLDQNHKIENINLNNLDEDLFSLLRFSDDKIFKGINHYEYDLNFKTAKNKNISTNVSILPMKDNNGELIGAVNVFRDITKEKRIRLNLSRYIPLHLVNDVINQDNLSMLQSKNRTCSILFSDIRNFTKLTEDLGPNQIVTLLNKYFESMVSSIHKHNGILDKFIGDALMGVFGVPYTNESDSINAVRCALDMLRILEKLNENKSLGLDLSIGIGISTGDVLSGNIGSAKRFEYTVIGDPVNLAARLEIETKKYCHKILICEYTYNRISPYFKCQEIDSVKLKGKRQPEKIYAVIGELSNEYVAKPAYK